MGKRVMGKGYHFDAISISRYPLPVTPFPVPLYPFPPSGLPVADSFTPPALKKSARR